ncbi:hypothetical protein JRI60_29185 [Archangium violaceum]|jgi:hypothetical protein|uniref:hypothetical protein n=1 Tax=Archangium violaceum TaxID=83451 RepID=UPI001952301D|nr:hypothetical protein [Archangium violaceum]QRN93267.1 hypothetical protein JRI60_29185 [Archangium violaceum]
MKRLVVSAVLMCTLTGCFRMSVRSGATPSGPENRDTGASMVWGLTTAQSSAPECSSGFSRVDVYWPWWGPFVYGITLGIVAPIRTEYVCAEGNGR